MKNNYMPYNCNRTYVLLKDTITSKVGTIFSTIDGHWYRPVKGGEDCINKKHVEDNPEWFQLVPDEIQEAIDLLTKNNYAVIGMDFNKQKTYNSLYTLNDMHQSFGAGMAYAFAERQKYATNACSFSEFINKVNLRKYNNL